MKLIPWEFHTVAVSNRESERNTMSVSQNRVLGPFTMRYHESFFCLKLGLMLFSRDGLFVDQTKSFGGDWTSRHCSHSALSLSLSRCSLRVNPQGKAQWELTCRAHQWRRLSILWMLGSLDWSSSSISTSFSCFNVSQKQQCPKLSP